MHSNKTNYIIQIEPSKINHHAITTQFEVSVVREQAYAYKTQHENEFFSILERYLTTMEGSLAVVKFNRLFTQF